MSIANRTVTIRYGTSLIPSFVKNLTAVGPNLENFEEAVLFPQPREKEASIRKAKFPSVSAVLGATDDNSFLFRWQKERIDEMGLAGFRKFMSERFELGKNVHSAVQKLLTLLRNSNVSTLDTFFQAANLNSQTPVGKYVTSLEPFIFKKLKPSDIIAYERPVSHPLLGFQGRFDAVLEQNGHMCIVDWKTSPAKSTFNKLGDESLSYASYGRQLAAYASAYNNDPSYADRPMITRGLLVSAKEDGSPAEVFELDEAELQSRFNDFKSRLQLFWARIEEEVGKNSADIVDFAYSPPAQE